MATAHKSIHLAKKVEIIKAVEEKKKSKAQIKYLRLKIWMSIDRTERGD
jgi:hypothetical protein